MKTDKKLDLKGNREMYVSNYRERPKKNFTIASM